MPDTTSSSTGTSEAASRTRPTYRIMRKGSRYNILGPQGRIFTKYQSASVAGPRWEELTHTPWPYQSSAYTTGHRLWELGLIRREQVGRFKIEVQPDPVPAMPSQPNPSSRAEHTPPPQPATKIVVLIPPTTMALPAPRIDLAEHKRLMRALRQNPVLIFDPDMRQVLQHEVAYNRPQARWAQHLLTLLARYERRQHIARRQHQHRVHTPAILAKHLAWQEQRGQAAAVN